MKSATAAVLLVVLVSSLGVHATLAAQRVTLDAAEQSRAGVIVRPVFERAFGDPLSIVGEVVRSPGQTLTVRTIVDGRVVEMLVSPGQRVGEGDSLVRLHSHEIDRMQGELLEMNEELRLAEDRAEAGRKLYELEGISRMERDAREKEAMAARIRLDRIRHELLDVGFTEEEIDRVLERGESAGFFTLRSPSKGVVLELAVQRHEWFRAFDPLLVVGDPRELELAIQISPLDAAGVSRGDMVEFAPVGRPEEAARGRVVTQIPRVDPVTRTVTVRAAIDDATPGLVPGVFVEGRIVRGDGRSAPSVPEKALIRIGDGDYVFVRVAADTFEAREVEVASFDGRRYEIQSGVEPGEDVAVEGVFLLKSALLARAGGGDESGADEGGSE